jgi:flagellar protein FlbD
MEARTMIVLTRLNGPSFALNPDLIERVDANPDTVVTLVGGIKYVVAESLDELVRRVCDFRGRVIAAAYAFEATPVRERSLRVVTDTENSDLAQAKDV